MLVTGLNSDKFTILTKNHRFDWFSLIGLEYSLSFIADAIELNQVIKGS